MKICQVLETFFTSVWDGDIFIKAVLSGWLHPEINPELDKILINQVFIRFVYK
jgi:hypothetical protein